MSDLIFVEAKNLQEFALELGAVGPDAQRAMKIATSRTLRWAASTVRRKMAKSLTISAHVVKHRMIVRATSEGGRLWVGLNPIDIKHLNPVQDAGGVQAGPARRPGAFIVQGLGGHVFVRKGRKRLPIKKAAPYEIKSEGELAIGDVGKKIGDKLMTEFERAFTYMKR